MSGCPNHGGENEDARTWRRRLPARPEGEAVLGDHRLVGKSPEDSRAAGWGDSNSGPPPGALPGGGGVGGLTCGSLARVVTAGARCAPPSAATHVPTVYRRASVSSGRRRSVLVLHDAFGGYHSAGGRCSRLGCEDRAGPPVGASTPTSPPAIVARIVANESGTVIPL